ncbi:hypothetical protein Hdeb2414_s0005g00175331 [Helianthus debilis subsp. tardiflorus]
MEEEPVFLVNPSPPTRFDASAAAVVDFELKFAGIDDEQRLPVAAAVDDELAGLIT